MSHPTAMFVHPESNGEMCFTMLETFRTYARERLRDCSEDEWLAEWQVAVVRDLAETAEPHISSAVREGWLSRLDLEVDNLRAALNRNSTRSDPCLGLRLVGALDWFWILRGYVGEGMHWTKLLLDLPVGRSEAKAPASALYAALAVAWKREDYPTARRYTEESLALRRELADWRGWRSRWRSPALLRPLRPTRMWRLGITKRVCLSSSSMASAGESPIPCPTWGVRYSSGATWLASADASWGVSTNIPVRRPVGTWHHPVYSGQSGLG